MFWNDNIVNGRYQRWFTKEDKMKAIRRTKARYMRNTRWFCEQCKKEYSLGSKWTHIRQSHSNAL